MKARTLDRKRPFGTVYGLSGVDHEQDGLYFNRSGDEVKINDVPQPAEEPPAAAEDDGSNVKPATLVVSTEPEEQKTKAYEDMHHMQLKAAMKMYGGEYVNREQAIAFLRGKKAA